LILCQSASQNVHLTYSVIKFLRFNGLVWEGESLPFRCHRLGDLVQAEISLTDRKGNRQGGIRWDQGQLFFPFDKNSIYDLSLRLEYRPPFFLETIDGDFGSIHPNSYEMSVDFLRDNLAGSEPFIGVTVGEVRKQYDLQTQKDRLPEGQAVVLECNGDHIGFSVKHDTAVPFGHKSFPRIHLSP